MNTGITSLSINKNPGTYLKKGTFADDWQQTVRKAAPDASHFDQHRTRTDEVSKFLTGLEWNDKTLTDVETDIVSVQYWKTPSGTTILQKIQGLYLVETIGDEALKTLPKGHQVTCGVDGRCNFGIF